MTIFETVLFCMVMAEFNHPQCQDEVQDEKDDELVPGYLNSKDCER